MNEGENFYASQFAIVKGSQVDSINSRVLYKSEDYGKIISSTNEMIVTYETSGERLAFKRNPIRSKVGLLDEKMSSTVESVHQVNHHLLLLQLSAAYMNSDEDKNNPCQWILITLEGKLMPLPILLE